MKYLKTYESYKHTKQDKIDDIRYIHEFVEKFEDMFEFRLNLNITGDVKFRSYLGFGADKYYYGNFILDNKRILSKKVNIDYNVNIETSINPHGITSENDIGRTFTISFDIGRNSSRNVNNIKHFHGYSRNMDDILQRFDEYVSNVLGIRHLTEEEKKQKKLEKTAKQYNL